MTSATDPQRSGGTPMCRRRPLHTVVLRPIGPWPYVLCSIVLQTRHVGPARSLLFLPEEGGVARRLQALARAVTPQSHCSSHWRTIPSHLDSHAQVECCETAPFPWPLHCRASAHSRAALV